MSTANGLLASDQKKALANILQQKLDEAKQIIYAKNELVTTEINGVVRERLGVELLEKMINAKSKEIKKSIDVKQLWLNSKEIEFRNFKEAKEAELKILTDKKNQLVGSSDYRMGGIAGKMKDNLLDKFDLDGRETKKMLWDLTSELWLATTTEEAKKIIEKPDEYIAKHQALLDELKPKMIATAKILEIPEVSSEDVDD